MSEFYMFYLAKNKSNKSKSQKVDIDNQSALANSVLTGLINNIVEHTKSLQKPSPNNSSESELQENPESKLQVLEYVPSIEMPEELVTESKMQETDMNECYLVKSSKDDHYEVSIKDQVQQNNNIKLAYFEYTCMDFRFHKIAYKHIFAIYQKFYIRPIIRSASNQAEKESKEICDVTFDNWVEALKKVWDQHTQED
ncbi:4670_t:CDS:2 [Gigaspora margarita]|uniref:4670_t:CDS:1 n=1 Tax=Gigaspora margarita TaxID=4874 RepID=A0ABN7UZQ0_GIGMA|nr:4670_t:CDS:2 [Gigaspora margarita]